MGKWWCTLHLRLLVIPNEALCDAVAPDGHVVLQRQQLRADALLYQIARC